MYEKDTYIKVKDNYELCLIYAPSYKKNISVKRIINHKYMGLRFRKIAKKMEKPDLIYTSFPTIDFAEEAVKYGKKNNVPVIVDVRDLWPDIFNHNLSKLKRIIAFPYIWLMQMKTKKLMKNAYAINGISNPVVEWGLKKANREKTDKDRDFFMGYERNDNITPKQIQNVDDKKFNLCFFGTLGLQFQFEKLINIAKLLDKEKDVEIYICGLGEKYDYLKENTEELSNVKLLGWVNKEELQYVLQSSKIGFAIYNPTFDFQMSTSNKFAEYLSNGLPVILTSGGFMGELIDKNNCGINSNNEEEIVKYVLMLKNNQDKYKEISNNAKKLYEEQFVAKNVYSNLVDYLEKIYKEEK